MDEAALSSIERKVGARAARSERRLLGEDGIWVLIFGDLLVFGIFFVTFFVSRNNDPGVFVQGRNQLNLATGVLNTLLLLTSSWLVALATSEVRSGRDNARKLLAGSILCGVGFCVVKVLEYQQKIMAGHTLNSSEFFTFYFMYTGIHLVHVLIGIAVLTIMWITCRTTETGLKSISFIEGGGAFWHLVDILWIAIFSILYLVS